MRCRAMAAVYNTVQYMYCTVQNLQPGLREPQPKGSEGRIQGRERKDPIQSTPGVYARGVPEPLACQGCMLGVYPNLEVGGREHEDIGGMYPP